MRFDSSTCDRRDGGRRHGRERGDRPGPGPIPEVIVTSTLLRDQALQQVPASLTVLDQAELSRPGQQHFEDVLAQVPNLNWAGGTSRPRYFQIRGIGEREQYEGAPNPSVGFSDR